MITVTKHRTKDGDTILEADGHAENKTVCAMFTAVTIAMLQNMKGRLGERPSYELVDGHFHFNTRGLGREAMVLFESYEYTVRQMKVSYPASFSLAY